jgi:hypothetical protein
MIMNISDSIKRLKEGNLTELEKYNMKKNMIELVLLAATITLFAAVKGDDDEAKRRRKMWQVKATLTLLNRVSGDIAFFWNPSQIAQTFQNTAPVVKLWTDIGGAVASIPSLFDDETQEYQTGSRKDENRFLSKTGRAILGIKPIMDIARIANERELEELR